MNEQPDVNSRPDANEFLTRLKQDAPQMLKDNVELAKAEMIPAAKAAGIGSGMFGGAGFFALRGLALLFYAAVFAVAMMFNQLVGKSALTSLALAFLIVGIVVLLIAVVLALIGKGQFKKVKAPQATVDEFKANLAALSAGVAKGRDEVTANLVERKALKATKKEAKDLVQRTEENQVKLPVDGAEQAKRAAQR